MNQKSNDFLLSNTTAKTLYYEALDGLPIFDYHSHIFAKEIFEDKKYANIGELWLKYDHYKWRAMRFCGVNEIYITGDKTSDRDKFNAWAGVLPNCIGSMLYSWSQIELEKCFGINELLDGRNAEKIWKTINKLLAEDGFRPRSLLLKAKVSHINTTDDPVDSLCYHLELAKDINFPVKVLPTWRPDRVLDVGRNDFVCYVHQLQKDSGISIDSFDALKKALICRMDFFSKAGCISSDHSLATVPFRPASHARAQEIFDKRMSGQDLSFPEEESYKTALLAFFAQEYVKRRWVMQLHIGAMRNNNSRMFERLGPDSGFDSMNDLPFAEKLAKLLDSLDYTGSLPKTVLYVLNPKDYYTLATIIGNYQSEEMPGKIQFGPAWWFNDHIAGIRRQLVDLANLTVLSNYIGMVTDSRCILSYFSRHEIFRRVLCNQLGEWLENSYCANDIGMLKSMVKAISYNNAKGFFGQS